MASDSCLVTFRLNAILGSLSFHEIYMDFGAEASNVGIIRLIHKVISG